MNTVRVWHAFATLLILLPAPGHARGVYTEADACRAALGDADLSGQAPETVMATIDLIREANRETLKTQPAHERAYQATLAMQSVLDRIAAGPVYRSEDGFATTEVLEGNEILKGYANRLEHTAGDLTRQRLAHLNARNFNLARLIGRSLAPVTLVGLSAAAFSYILRQPELNAVALAGWTIAVGGLGYLAADELQGVATRWRAYVRPELRDAWSLAQAKLRPSDFFQSFRSLTAFQVLISHLAKRENRSVGTFAIQSFNMLNTELPGSVVDSLVAAPPAGIGEGFSATSAWHIHVDAVFYIEAKSNRPYAVVHVRGDRLNR